MTHRMKIQSELRVRDQLLLTWLTSVRITTESIAPSPPPPHSYLCRVGGAAGRRGGGGRVGGGRGGSGGGGQGSLLGGPEHGRLLERQPGGALCGVGGSRVSAVVKLFVAKLLGRQEYVPVVIHPGSSGGGGGGGGGDGGS